MKFRPILLIALGLALLGAAVLAARQPARAQSAETACINCHETQAKNPVREVGAWHVQHNMVACEVCHSGDPKADTQEAAHATMNSDPLNPGESCSLCHPDVAQDYIAQYQAQVTPKAPPTEAASPTPAATPTVAATATLEPGSCRVVATECAVPGAAEPGAAEASAAPTAAPTATSAPSATPTAAATSAPAAAVAPAGGSGFSWMKALQFTRGPLYKTAFWFFVIGMLLRLYQALRAGWKHRAAEDKIGRAAAAGKSFATGLLVLPFIPGLKGAFRRKPVIYIAGGLFHLALLVVVLFSKTHMTAWKSVIGFGWPVLPPEVVHWLAAVGVVAMLALLINRIADPVLRLISGPAEWINWLAVFLPMLTGFVLARKLLLAYEVSFTIHMLLVDLLLIWIPLSRISHFIFYFFSRAIHGVEFYTRRVATR